MNRLKILLVCLSFSLIAPQCFVFANQETILIDESKTSNQSCEAEYVGEPYKKEKAKWHSIDERAQEMYSTCLNELYDYAGAPPDMLERRTKEENMHTLACQQFIDCYDENPDYETCSILLLPRASKADPRLANAVSHSGNASIAINDFSDFLYAVKESFAGDARLLTKTAVDFYTKDMTDEEKEAFENDFYSGEYVPDGRKASPLDFWGVAGDTIIVGAGANMAIYGSGSLLTLGLALGARIGGGALALSYKHKELQKEEQNNIIQRVSNLSKPRRKEEDEQEESDSAEEDE